MKEFFLNTWENVKSVFVGLGEKPFFLVAGILLMAALTVAYYVMFRFLKNNGVQKVGYFFILYMVLGAVVFLFTPISNQAYIVVPVAFLFGIILLYSAEIKKSLRYGGGRLDILKRRQSVDEETVKKSINAIITSLQNMSKKDIGAIIVLSNDNVPRQILESGTKLDAEISSELIESVFFPKTMLHDGAMIINGTRIEAAGCFLPLSQNENIPKDLGTRHRAGIGITEGLDVTALIVSEESGIISIVKAGKITRYADADMLRNELSRFYWRELTSIGK